MKFCVNTRENLARVTEYPHDYIFFFNDQWKVKSALILETD